MENYEVKMDDNRLKYVGRIELEDGLPLFTFPLTSVELNFIGTSIKIEISNYRWIRRNFVGVFIDEKEYTIELIPTSEPTIYTIAENLENKLHKVKFYKMMDSAHYIKIHKIILDGQLEERPETKKLKMEVYGDSISAGAVVMANDYLNVEDPEHDGEYSNAFYSYANLTAQKLGAEIHDIAQGGIALMNGTGNFHGLTKGMEWAYDKVRYNPHMENVTTWDFSKYTPDIVIIALGQNCKKPTEFMDDIESDMAKKWREHYIEFVRKIRGHYENALIVLQTSIMVHHENYDKSITIIVEELNDEKVVQCIFTGNGATSVGHVRVEGSELMSDELVKVIKSKI